MVDLLDIIARFRTKGILLDTNLLILLVVGLYRRDRISKFNRTRQYTINDFDLITAFIHQFPRRITTPHILAETDNLMRQMDRNEHRALSIVMSSLVSTLLEICVPSVDAVRQGAYDRLGLTDSAIQIAAVTEDVLVVTDDAKLANWLAHAGRDVLNINHVRMLNWN
ncbi:hypothetical protein GJ689_13880 [Rhodoplanes serenus]|uniref:PIN domain-containing protein n=1 Tax=Rhodoplanes serenus TaxID=200615 RepID=A0A9X4XLC8_9BRAD|nr:hypothetical protein [Rhodoplanes serenus]MTW17292.1 hypothetical protein [Rhodoplanes serenus]